MVLENEFIWVEISTKGAELQHLKKKSNQLEYLWQGDPTFWARRAPILFPFVGRLKEDLFYYHDETYHLGQHGFARDETFVAKKLSDTEAVFGFEQLAQDEFFPFPFQLSIGYRLAGSQLIVSYDVQNLGDDTMYFSIGGHPAFNCPLQPEHQRSDYQLVFDEEEHFETHRLEDGLFTGQKDWIGDGKLIDIHDHLFDQDALVFKNLNSNQVSLNYQTEKRLTFHFEGFPFLGIWSKNSKSPFVCIEPWFGLADNMDHNQKIEQKEGINVLMAGTTFSCEYQIEIH